MKRISIPSEIWLITIILFVAYVLRTWGLWSFPPGILYDEQFNTKDIDAIMAGQITPFFPGNFGREALYIYLQAASVAIFGASSFSLRWVSVAIGLLTISSAYVLARRLFGLRVALVTAALLSSSLWHLIFSRIGLRAISLPLFECLALYWMWRALMDPIPDVKSVFRNPARYLSPIITGIMFGLSLYTYTAARFLPFVLLLFGVTCLVAHRARARALLLTLVFIGVVFALIAIPLSAYFAYHPQDFVERASQVSIVSAGEQGEGLFSSAVYSISRTILAFASEGDRNWDRNISGRPIFDPIMLALFLAGIILSLLHRRRDANRLAFITLLVMLLPHVLTSSHLPNYLRLVGILPVLYIFPALVFDCLAKRCEHSGRRYNRAVASLTFLLLAATLLRTGHDYFGTWVNNPNVVSEFGGQEAHAARFALQQLAGGFQGPVYLSAPVSSDDKSRTGISRYIVPDSLKPWMDKISPFDGSVCLVEAADDIPEILVVMPKETELQMTGNLRPSANRQNILNGDDVSAWRYTGKSFGEPEVSVGYSFGGSVTLTGYDLPRTVRSGETITPTLYWRIDQSVDYALGLGIHVINASHEAVAKIDSRQMAFDLRLPGERMISWLAPSLPSSTPSGKYSILVTLYSMTELRPLEVVNSQGKSAGHSALLGPFKVRGLGDETTPAKPLGARFGEYIVLRGYTLKQLVDHPDQISVQLHWLAKGVPEKDYTVFVHLYDSQGAIIAQHDGPPSNGGFPTSMWEARDTISDIHVLTIKQQVTPKIAQITVGMYDPATGQRLSVGTDETTAARDGMLLIDPAGWQ